MNKQQVFSGVSTTQTTQSNNLKSILQQDLIVSLVGEYSDNMSLAIVMSTCTTAQKVLRNPRKERFMMRVRRLDKILKREKDCEELHHAREELKYLSPIVFKLTLCADYSKTFKIVIASHYNHLNGDYEEE